MAITKWCCTGLLIALQMYTSSAKSTGAPLSACESMTPGHGFNPQSSASMYDIKHSNYEYCPMHEVNITLVGAPYGTTFKGFLCQPRTSVDSVAPSGRLTAQAQSTTVVKQTCDLQASLTHVSNGQKKEVHFTWIPDSTKTDDINIVCTIVQEYKTYWIKQAISIRYARDRCTSDGNVKGLPDTCSDSQTCEAAISMSVCNNEKCECPSDMKIANPTHTYCSPKVLGDTCNSDSDCMRVAESMCNDGVCTCKSAFTSNTTENCYLKVLGDSCSSNDDCRGIPKSICNGTCKCPPQYKHKNNQTHTNCALRVPGDACTINAQCAGTAGAECMAGKCTIDTNACMTDKDCTGTDATTCIQGKCTSGGTKVAVLPLSFLLSIFVLLGHILIY